MSGPITRQYGVPNWDEIFGKKEEHPANPKVTGEPVEKDESSNDDRATDRKENSADK